MDRLERIIGVLHKLASSLEEHEKGVPAVSHEELQAPVTKVRESCWRVLDITQEWAVTGERVATYEVKVGPVRVQTLALSTCNVDRLIQRPEKLCPSSADALEDMRRLMDSCDGTS